MTEVENDQNNIQSSGQSRFSPAVVIVIILVAAWIIGMSILAAGWLISKEIAKQSIQSQPIAGTQLNSTTQQVQIDIPAGMPILGNNNAPITVVEYADFQCPYCGEFQKNIFPTLKKDFIDTGKIRFAFMNFPFLGDESFKAAEAARCATDQNKFWEYHDKLYEKQSGENQGAFTDEKLKAFAKDVGLDTAQFNQCLDSRKYQSEISSDVDKATNFGVQSTPTLFINGYKYEGLQPYSSYSTAIGNQLAKK